ncbi:uncharacterized protein C8Q71DRAFT_730007 [Rhodofomes roseus]|uniref:Protein kinase domain-containing protein n=1 Tax=Rhodofomes roseus TaxID=34475 RepID=A0ABQ8KZ65_9APHY|nr:uncharacterized protein C8Q71DRAFT_730007 [Rhodofomes roseus]KAH9843772.1 hypothetical protein C8Q71DRAFT_730007 [Rhodofomes roseus]
MSASTTAEEPGPSLQQAVREHPDCLTSSASSGLIELSESYWTHRHGFFERNGYRVTPQYMASVATWMNDRFGARKDAAPLAYAYWADEHIVRATRTSDNAPVCIKRVATASHELRIASMFSSTPLCDDLANHAVPILDVLRDEDNEYVSYIVMPFLRHIDDPPVGAVGDVVEFVDQMLEGLAFLHRLGVAHRDCSYANLMMDASGMGHPFYNISKPSGGLWPMLWRSTLDFPIKYYFIDFGLSVHIPLGRRGTLVLGNEGRDRDAPELRRGDKVPYDPFKLDVFLLGNLFRKAFIDNYANVEFLCPLVVRMIREDPMSRPDAADVLGQWRCIHPTLSRSQKRARLQTHWDRWIKQAALDVLLVICLSLLGVRLALKLWSGAGEW